MDSETGEDSMNRIGAVTMVIVAVTIVAKFI
jgi:hypothetical protein